MSGAGGPAPGATGAGGRVEYRRAPTHAYCHHDRPTRRRSPPYLRKHAERLRANPSATIWVAIGSDAWRWSRERVRTHHVIVVPPGDDPGEYDWRLCAQHDPVLLRRAGTADGDHVRALVEALIRDGVDRVLDTTSGAIYVAKGVSDAAA